MYKYEYNYTTKQYDVYLYPKTGAKVYDCSFNIEQKARQYCDNMNNY